MFFNNSKRSQEEDDKNIIEDLTKKVMDNSIMNNITENITNNFFSNFINDSKDKILFYFYLFYYMVLGNLGISILLKIKQIFN